MPRYQVQCSKCEREQEIFRTLAEMDELPGCCGQRMHRIMVAAQIQPDIQPYKSMIDGSMIAGRSQHREHLKRHNCFEVGNEVKAHMNSGQRKPIDRERRRRDIAAVINSKL